MNEFDQCVKYKLKAKYYIRYADDFVFLSENKNELKDLLYKVKNFLGDKLKLNLHPEKVFMETLASGVDFLGWIHFANHRVLRTVTKRRMFRRIIKIDRKEETIKSYMGLLGHGNTKKIRDRIGVLVK